MKNKQFTAMAIIAIIAVAFIGCGGGDDTPPQKQTPVIEDFNISGTGTYDYDGTAKTVTITPKANKTTGAITIYYNGTTTAPIAINTYTVTFNVAEAEGYNAVNGLSAGTITIEATIKTQPFTIGTVSFVFEYNKYDTTSWEKFSAIRQTYNDYIIANTESSDADIIVYLANRTGANYKITVDYSDEGKATGFTATDWQTLNVGNDYLTNTNLTRSILRTAFNAMLAKSLNETTKSLTFGTGCAVTVKSDDQFTADQWASLCNDVVTAIMRGYNTAPSEVVKNAVASFFSNNSISISLLKSATYNIEVKSDDHRTMYLKADNSIINSINGTDMLLAIGAMMNDDDSSYHYPE